MKTFHIDNPINAIIGIFAITTMLLAWHYQLWWLAWSAFALSAIRIGK